MTERTRPDLADMTPEQYAAAVENAEPMPPEGEAAPSNKLGPFWQTIGERSKGGGDWFAEKPPARRYLLNAKGDKGDVAGMLPLGKVGMLAAAGAAGKTWALTQLALAVATGRDWLDTYGVASPGHVLLALAEEDAGEMRRRLFHAARLMGLDGEATKLAAERIVALPLAGEAVALTVGADEATPGALPITPLAAELREKLEGAGVDWRLVILDPMSRFAGPDVEIDNAQATRFVQVLEGLLTVRGGPTVLFAHHTNKTARREGTNDATAARGSSGLTDGARWQAALTNIPHPGRADLPVPRMAVLEVVKSNLAMYPEPLWLARDDEHNGALRPATPSERADWERADRLNNADKKAAAHAAKGTSAAGNGRPKTDTRALALVEDDP